MNAARLLLCLLTSFAFNAPASQSTPLPTERFWPQWRGPYATGVSKTAKPPLQWSDTKNIKWKIEIPGRGSASSIVWDNRADYGWISGAVVVEQGRS